jgi:NADPH:quinone reductase-like Zn-dependent oxidoreductase
LARGPSRPSGALTADSQCALFSDQAPRRSISARRGVRTSSPLVEPFRLALTAIADLVTAGRLHPEIAAVLPLAQARRAHELGETGQTRGKIVLQVI